MEDEPNGLQTNLDKKVVRTSPVLWILGAVLAILLCGLGTRALFDIADLFPEPSPSEFRDPLVKPLERERGLLEERDENRRTRLERAESDLEAQERALRTAEESWRTWLETRGTLGGTGAEDREVRARRDRLDRLRAERDEAAARLAAMRREPDPLAKERQALQERIAAAEAQAEQAYDKAARAWKMKVLSARLGLVVPVLALALWLWPRRRRTKYLTLLWGYFAFAVWILGVGIYPYLPHYGGYMPLVAGVVATVWLSISLVRFFNRRIAVRRQRIVDRFIARHRCPGCERDYLVGRENALDLGVARKAASRHFDQAALRPRSCPACGLPLFRECPACRAEQVAHLDHCAACGAPWPGAGGEERAPAQAAG
jgi:hypothetical protein